MKNLQVVVVGAGTMGHGIAQEFAAHGYPTVLIDKNPQQIETAKTLIAGNLEVMKAEEAITEEQIENVARLLSYGTEVEKSAPQAGLIVEAIPEHPQYKQELFSQLDGLCPADTILASTTSVLNIYEFVSVSNPERLIITHWCNPPHIIPLVEIVMGPETSEETTAKVREILTGMGKKPAVLRKCVPGFIVNRLNAALGREAGYMVAQGWVSPEDVDAAFSGNAGIKAPFEGPLELMDYIGWDIATAAGQYLYPHLCNSTDRNVFAENMVEKGWLGIKSGKGIKDYTGKTREELQNKRNRKIMQIARLVRKFGD
ncbi:MAG: 3-hydroxyacyl-CoA dehydrogenase family protein [Syntrophomonadaceae bacterium]|jgi:3-hydroxybutyryl-CoA dehydrogenase|nr:3-hydroxyacyl-CoA dehydrogenase family protein [Syntrophomonadaceae bacterium]